ncbi:Protein DETOXIFICATION 30 [Zea mays]|uniref:Protein DETOXIFICATION n=1 Tax=Zea mays TaxID=4577 RepID=A0A3L6EZP6_MAIZE|nr:Protein DETOXIFICATION 30 [Zea mays]
MAVTSGHSERADEPLKEALLAARNGSGSDGDGDGEKDLEEIRSVGSFLRHAAEENRKLWYLAGPAIITSITQYSLGGITQVFAGHLTTLELDAISTENNVIAGLAFGIMLGMGSALETLCGQAYGAKQLHMLGVYMQRSLIILNAMAVLMLPLYLFATPILRFFHQDAEIAALAGRLALYMIPQLFAYAFNFPIQKFLQAQSRRASWLLVGPMGMGIVGLAVALNASWWLVVLGQLAYILMGYCPGAWNGFDWLAFSDLSGFARLSLGSAVMLWCPGVLVLHVPDRHRRQPGERSGRRCCSLHLIMVFFGFNAAISVRVSNELGAGRPRAAKFAILVVLMSSVAIGLAFFVLVLAFRDVYGAPFTESPEVVRAVASLGVVFAFSLLLNSVQPVLSGVAVGAGWQWLVAYINLGCYYLVGIPVGYIIAFPLRGGVQGMWGGMLTGVGLQTARPSSWSPSRCAPTGTRRPARPIPGYRNGIKGPTRSLEPSYDEALQPDEEAGVGATEAAPAEADDGIEVCCFDNRGVGHSSVLPNKSYYSTTIMATDALALMDHLGWKKAHVFGHSMGAMIACKLDAMAPHRLCSLALLNVTRGGFQCFPKVDAQMLSLAFCFLRAKTLEKRALVDLETHYTKISIM